MPQQPLVGLGLLIIEASQSHSDTTLGRSPLEERSAQRTDLYLTAHKTKRRQISMLPAGFEPTIPARTATGIGNNNNNNNNNTIITAPITLIALFSLKCL
jgi:hypothetical protein